MNTYRADLHVHTKASIDGRSTLEALTAAAQRAGLQAIAIADHNQCTHVPAEMNGVLLIPACEISTQAGHITGLFLGQEVDIEALGRLPEPEKAVAAIRRAGGLAVMAHPFERPDTPEKRFSFDLDGMETANARACFKAPDANERAAAMAGLRGLPQVGGSDAHDAKEVGNAYTELEAEALSLSALRCALAQGECRAVLVKNTPHLRKGLSQWTKAWREGGVLRLGKAAVYVAYCAGLDLVQK